MSVNLQDAWDTADPVSEDEWEAAAPVAGPSADALANAFLARSFGEAFKGDVERRAAVLRLAEDTGAGADFVERQYDTLKTSWERSKFDAAAWRQANPEVAKVVLANARLAPIVMRDEKVSGFVRALRKLSARLTLGQQAIYGEQEVQPVFGGAPVRVGNEAMAPPAADLAEAERELAGTPRQVPVAEGGPPAPEGLARVGAIFGDAYRQQEISRRGFSALVDEVLGLDTWEQEKAIADLRAQLAPRDYGEIGVLDSIAQAAASQTSSVLAGGGGALALGVPAALATRGAAGPAAALGFKAGVTASAFVHEAGAAFLEYRDAKDEAGQPIDRRAAMGGALLYGALSAAVETASFGATAKSLGPFAEAMAAGKGRAFVRGLLTTSQGRRVALRMLKAWGQRSGTEGLEEFVQTALQDEIAQQIGDASITEAGTIEKGGTAAVSAVVGTAVVGGGQSAVTGLAQVRAVTNEIRRDAEAKSAETVQAITDVADSPTARASPRALAELIERETAASGEAVTHLYVDPSKAAEVGAPVDPQALRDALATGGKLEVPVAEYLERWAPAVGDKLTEHVATRPGYMTATEAKGQEAEIEAEAKALAAEPVSEIPAVEAAVAQQAERMGLQALPQDVLGIEPEQYQAYLEEQAKAKSTSARRAELAAKKEALREKEAWWREAEGKEREAADAEYEALPARKAALWLRGKVREADGTLVPVTVPKLDLAATREILGVELARKVPTAKRGGMHPDDMAALVGYDSGRAMLEAVAALKEKDAWVKETASSRMAEKHPSLLEDRERLRQEVSRGLHGEESSRWLLREIKALGAKAGAGRVRAEAIRRAAAIMVSRQAVGTINAHVALVRERGAANRKAISAAKGEWGRALVYAQQQLLNMHLWRELDVARDEREAFLDLAADLRKPAARARLGKASPVYRDGVDMLLEALGLKEVEQRDQPLPSLDQVVAQMEADGTTILFDPATVGAALAQGRPWKDLTLAEMREVFSALKNIRAAARARATVLVEGRRLDRQEVLEALRAEALTNVPSRGEVASSLSARTRLQVLRDGWNTFDGALRKPQELILKLGGGDVASMWYRAIAKPLQDGKAAEADFLREAVAPILQAFDKIPKEVRRRFMEPIDGRALFPNHRVEGEQDLAPPSRRFELLALALNAGNESNLQALTEGRNVTLAELEVARELLTDEELGWVQSALDGAESFKKPAFDLEERLSGVRPKEVVARPFTVRGKTYRGGYWPRVYDRRVEVVGEKQAARSIADLQDPTFTRPATAHGHLKSRVENFSGAISLELSTIPAHLGQVAHDLAFREALQSVGGLVLSREVQSLLKDRLGDGRARQILPWLKDIGQMRAMEGATHAGPILRVVRAIRANTVTAVLGYSAQTAIADFSNLLAAVPGSELRTRHWMAGLAEFTAHPMRTAREAWSKSGELRTRRDQLQRELQRQVKQFTARGPLAKGPIAWAKHYAFSFMQFTDWATATPLWVGAYRQALAEGRNERDAVSFADATIQHLFPSHSAVDAAPLVRDRGPIGTGLLFYGFFNTVYNVSANLVEARRYGRLAAYILAVGAAGELLAGRGKEDEEEWVEWVLRKTVATALATFPYGGDLANLAERRLLGKQANPRTISIAAVAYELGDAAIGAFDGDKDADRRLAALLRALAPVTGVPTSQPLRTGGYVADMLDGDVKPQDPFDVLGGVVYGEREDQPANIPSLISDVLSGEE